MSETTTASASTKAAEKAIKAVAAASETLPTVVETVEIAMDVPAKIVLNQRLVVIVTAVGGVTAGAAGLWAVNKLRQRLAVKKLNRQIDEDVAVNTGLDNS
jgi:hypothetical protein